MCMEFRERLYFCLIETLSDFIEIEMNISQANNLDFPDLLARLGHHPVKTLKSGLDNWYYSPFRKEKEPSFHIRAGREYHWVWYDFGHDGASTILDFIMQYRNTDKRGALAFLDTLYPNYKGGSKTTPSINPNQVSFLFPSQSPPQATIFKNKEAQERDFEFIEDLPLQSEAIFTYLESRKISRRIASKYFRVVKYRHKEKLTQKPYFGFGMKNESGGWEVRSASDREREIFKTALIAKDISVIKGSQQGRVEVNVFEGMTDFVSLLAMLNVEGLRGDALILHGLKLYGRAAAYIKENGYSQINTFLDNNPPGIEASERFLNDFGAMAINQSPKFLPHVDLNDVLRDGFNPFSPRAESHPHP